MIGLLLSYALDISVLALVAWAAPLRGGRLFLALFVLSWLIGSFSLVIEAAAFSVMTFQQALAGAGAGGVQFALMAALVTAGANQFKPKHVPIARTSFTWLRLTAVVVAYISLYVMAGMMTLPYVREFYVGRTIPGLGIILPLQVFRALIFVVGSALLLRGGLRYAPWILGLAFSVIGGIAPLAPDNPFMPLAMRIPHVVEVGISNFLFGFVTALLLRTKNAKSQTQ